MASELEQQIENRERKCAELREAGVDPYPSRVDYDMEPRSVHARYGEREEAELAEGKLNLRVPGRVRALRKHGKTSFLDLHDGVEKLQVMVRRERLSESAAKVLDAVDLGDYLLASGLLIRTRTGELTIAAEDLTLLAKAMRPLPEKWHGLKAVEVRYRRRYLDLASNRDTLDTFV